MKDEKETKKNLLKAARAEFLEKGYMNASLRSICKEAGVTTGALYFFFKDKEELFDALVREPVEQIFQMAKIHYRTELSGRTDAENVDFSDDLETAVAIIHYMYQHYEEMLLILTKAQGSHYETIVDEFVAVTEAHYRILTDQMTKAAGREQFGDYFIHWMSHMQTDIFVHLLTHERDEEKAIGYMKETVRYLVAGWYGLLQKS